MYVLGCINFVVGVGGADMGGCGGRRT